MIHYFLLKNSKLPIQYSSLRKTKDYDSILRHHLMKISFYAEKNVRGEKKKVKSPTKNTQICLLRIKEKTVRDNFNLHKEKPAVSM